MTMYSPFPRVLRVSGDCDQRGRCVVASINKTKHRSTVATLPSKSLQEHAAEYCSIPVMIVILYSLHLFWIYFGITTSTCSYRNIFRN